MTGRARIPKAFAVALLAACAQTPTPAPEACTEGLVRDEDGVCVPEACGVDPRAGLSDADVIWVSADAEDGDGSADSPMGSVQAALDLAVAERAEFVFLSPGTYTETLQIQGDHDDITLQGRCRELTTLDAENDDDLAALTLNMGTPGRSFTARDLTLRHGSFGVNVEVGQLTMQRARVEAAAGFGVVCQGRGAMQLEDLELVGTTARRRDQPGVGLIAVGCDLIATGLTVSDNESYGVDLELGATLDLRESLISGNGDGGLLVKDPGSAVTLEDVTVRGGGPGDYIPAGVLVGEEAHATLSHVRIEDVVGVGVYVEGSGLLTLEDSALVGMRSATGRAGLGVGVYVSEDGVFDGTKLEILDNDCIGAAVDRGALQLRDSTLSHNGGAGCPGNGGLSADRQASVELQDLTLSENWGKGISAFNRADLTLSGVVIEGTTQLSGTEDSPVGLLVMDGATVRGQDIRLLHNCYMAAYVGTSNAVQGEGATLQLEDFLVEDVSSCGGEWLYPGGIIGLYGSEISLTRGLISGVSYTGLAAFAHSTLLLDSVQVKGTTRAPEASVGMGLVIELDSAVSATELDIEGSEGPGAAVLGGSALDCSGCTLQGNQFGGVLLSNGSSLTLRDQSTVLDNGPHPNEGGGFGIHASDVDGPVSVRVEDSFVGPHALAAIYYEGGGLLTLLNSEIQGNSPSTGGERPGGNGLVLVRTLAYDGASGVMIDGDSFTQSDTEATLIHDGDASFGANQWSDNAVDLRWQGCGERAPQAPAGVRVCELCPPYDEAMNDVELMIDPTVPGIDR